MLLAIVESSLREQAETDELHVSRHLATTRSTEDVYLTTTEWNAYARSASPYVAVATLAAAVIAALLSAVIILCLRQVRGV